MTPEAKELKEKYPHLIEEIIEDMNNSPVVRLQQDIKMMADNLPKIAEIVERFSKQRLEMREQMKKAELVHTAKERDWEITVYKFNGDFYVKDVHGDFVIKINPRMNGNPLLLMHKEKAQIHTVRRLSDGVEFSVGEQTVDGKIDSFEFLGRELQVLVNGGWKFGAQQLKKIERKCLFRTEDGVEVFEGDSYWLVGDDWGIYKTDRAGKDYVDCLTKIAEFLKDGKCSIAFSTREKAEEYVLLHRPCLSVFEIQLLSFESKDRLTRSYNLQQLFDLVKSKP